jgi:predicted nucleotidyltransferase
MIIGGQAVLQYGRPRLTEDIDVTLGVDRPSLPVVLKAVKEISLYPRVQDIDGMVKKTNVLPLVEKESGVKVDCIFSFIPYERQAIERANRVIVAGQTVRMAAVEDVVIHKMIASRPRDIEDIVGILNISAAKIEREYLLRWLESFSETLNRSLRTEFENIENTLKR